MSDTSSRGYPHAPKRAAVKKTPTQAQNPNAVIKPGMTQAQIQEAIKNRGQAGKKPLDTYGIGSWSSKDSNTTWGAAMAWLLDGNTNAYTATKTIFVKGKQYIGNDHDGYVQVAVPSGHRGFGPRTPSPSEKKSSGRQSFTQKGLKQPARTNNADEVVEAFSGLAKSNAARFGQIQQLMFQAGLYGTAAPIVGSFSGTDQQVFLTAVQAANTAGIPLQDYLADRAAKAQAQGIGAGPKRVPLTVKYSNPLSIAAAVNTPDSTGVSNAGQAIGRNLTPQELQAYIDKIHNGERVAQVAADNANPTYTATGQAPPPDPGGVVTEPEGVTGAEVQADAAAAHPAEAAGTRMGERASQIYQLLSQHLAGGVQAQ